MIVQVLRLTRWEFFKVGKRWMPWILLAVAIVVVQATLWGFYSSYGNIDDPPPPPREVESQEVV